MQPAKICVLHNLSDYTPRARKASDKSDRVCGPLVGLPLPFLRGSTFKFGHLNKILTPFILHKFGIEQKVNAKKMPVFFFSSICHLSNPDVRTRVTQ
jgi:hypothetical protein